MSEAANAKPCIAGMDSPNRVRIATARRTLVIHWSDSAQLLRELRSVDFGDAAIAAFEAAGASGPVELDSDGKAAAFIALQRIRRGLGAADRLPPRLSELRSALIDDLCNALIDDLAAGK